MPRFKPLQSRFKPGDRVRFNKETRAQLSAVEHGPGVVIDNRPLDVVPPEAGGPPSPLARKDEGVWVQVHWDNDSWSTEKPEWLELWEKK